MKELTNWRALIEKENGFENGFPLPGCSVEGEVEGVKIFLQNAYFDFTNQLVTTSINAENTETYKLGYANEKYITMLNEFIEFSKTQENQKDGNEIGE